MKGEFFGIHKFRFYESEDTASCLFSFLKDVTPRG